MAIKRLHTLFLLCLLLLTSRSFVNAELAMAELNDVIGLPANRNGNATFVAEDMTLYCVDRVVYAYDCIQGRVTHVFEMPNSEVEIPICSADGKYLSFERGSNVPIINLQERRSGQKVSRITTGVAFPSYNPLLYAATDGSNIEVRLLENDRLVSQIPSSNFYPSFGIRDEFLIYTQGIDVGTISNYETHAGTSFSISSRTYFHDTIAGLCRVGFFLECVPAGHQTICLFRMPIAVGEYYYGNPYESSIVKFSQGGNFLMTGISSYELTKTESDTIRLIATNSADDVIVTENSPNEFQVLENSETLLAFQAIPSIGKISTDQPDTLFMEHSGQFWRFDAATRQEVLLSGIPLNIGTLWTASSSPMILQKSGNVYSQYNLSTEQKIRDFGQWVSDACFSDTGNLVAIRESNVLSVYDEITTTPLLSRNIRTSAAAFSFAGDTHLLLAENNLFLKIPLNGDAITSATIPSSYPVEYLACSPNGNHAVLLSGSSYSQIWNVKDMKFIRYIAMDQLIYRTGSVARFSPDSLSFVVNGSSDAGVLCYAFESTSGKLFGSYSYLPQYDGGGINTRFSPTGEFFYVADSRAVRKFRTLFPDGSGARPTHEVLNSNSTALVKDTNEDGIIDAADFLHDNVVTTYVIP